MWIEEERDKQLCPRALATTGDEGEGRWWLWYCRTVVQQQGNGAAMARHVKEKGERGGGVG